jgi:hypothetical protein
MVTEVVGLVAMTEVFRTSCVVDVLCVCCVIQSDGGDGKKRVRRKVPGLWDSEVFEVWADERWATE